ncbi:MFS domain-containing protein [Gammaproteobacteria bacterium]
MTIKNSFAKKITLQAIIIILLAACFYLYEFYMQVAPGVIQQELMRDFAIDATKLGLLSGCFYLSYTPLQLLSGLLLDRYSTRVILTCICSTFALGVLLFAHASSIYVAAIARFIMGGAASCAFISVLHLVARWIPPIHFALFAGIAETMGAIGGYGGTEHVAILLKYFDWRTTITGFAYAGFMLAILIVLIVRNQPIEHKNIQTQTNNHSIWFDLKTILSNRETWTIGIYSLLIWTPILGFSALWGVEFIRIGHNFDKIAAAHAVAFVWLGVALASPVLGWISDFIGRRCILMTICALAGAIAMTIAIFITNIPTTILYFLMFLIGFASAGQTLSFALIKDNNSPYTNSAANGFNNMILVASGLFQPLIGKILDLNWQGTIQNGIHVYSLHSYQIALLMLPACCFVAALISIFLIKETRCVAIWQK